MNQPRILSAFQELPDARPTVARPVVLVFDACHVGVVLRAVMFVEAVVAVGAMFSASGFWDWFGRTSVLTGGALPATLAWLVVGCLLKKMLARLPQALQFGAGVLLGGVAGLYGAAILALVGVFSPVPWLACAFGGGLMAALLVTGLRLRARARGPAAAAARLTELQARIRPHFLFNTLNSAIALVRAEPARAEMLLEDLSDLFRSALVDQGPSVSLDSEIALAQRYLAIEQVRFDDRLRVTWTLDPLAGDARLPPLLLQPLVENAVKHGAEPSDSGADITVLTERRGERVVIKVINTVPAGQGESGQGLALTNVRDRLSLLHDVQASFATLYKDRVYQVRIEIPAGPGDA